VSLDKNAVELKAANNGASARTPFSHTPELPFAFQLIDHQCPFVFLEHLRGLEDLDRGQFRHSLDSWCHDREQSFFDPLYDFYLTARIRKKERENPNAKQRRCCIHHKLMGRTRSRSGLRYPRSLTADAESRGAIDVCMSDHTASEPDDKEDRIAFVLDHFKVKMHQSDRELADSENRLRTDSFFYEAWCTRIHEWCRPPGREECPARFLPPGWKAYDD